MKSPKANINPDVLLWAREAAGLNLADAAQQAGIKDSKTLSAAEKLNEWETGEDAPTRNQIASLAKAYYRPVLTFYMKQPPQQSKQIADFRTVGDHPAAEGGNLLSAFVRKMKVKQSEIKELLSEDEDDLEELGFVGSVTPQMSPIAIADKIREMLDLDSDTQRRLRDKDALFRALRQRVEDLGVFVLLQGNLGSFHTNIEADEFRGIALADPIAPFIILNSNDAKAARTFTLLHELAHIWLGETGVSNYSPFAGHQAEVNIEALCNQVATEFLMPRESFANSWNDAVGVTLYERVASQALEFSVSRAATANRLWKLNLITEDQWWQLYRTYQNEWRALRARQRQQDGGPSYYTNKRNQLGNAILKTVFGAIDSGALTYTHASRILGVNAKNFDGLKARVGSA